MLEKHGIVSDADCLQIEDLPDQKMFALYDSLYHAVLDSQEKQLADRLQMREADELQMDPFRS